MQSICGYASCHVEGVSQVARGGVGRQACKAGGLLMAGVFPAPGRPPLACRPCGAGHQDFPAGRRPQRSRPATHKWQSMPFAALQRGGGSGGGGGGSHPSTQVGRRSIGVKERHATLGSAVPGWDGPWEWPNSRAGIKRRASVGHPPAYLLCSEFRLPEQGERRGESRARGEQPAAVRTRSAQGQEQHQTLHGGVQAA